jgi:di/tricarboxylate transporter
LRHLEGLFLVEIDRAGRIITPVSPDQPIEADDRLVFAGVVSTIVDLQRIRGLVPDTEDAGLAAPAGRLIEAVVSSSSPLVRGTIRAANFRTIYDAAVVAVHRNGERIPGKIGEITLRAGDTLLLQTGADFVAAHRNSPDFYLISEVDGEQEPHYEKAWIAVSIMVAMVVVAATGILPISIAAPLAAGALIGTRCISGNVARQAVDVPVLVVIGAGLGIAFAMHKTGAAQAIAGVLVAAVGDMGPMATLIAVYTVTVLLAETLHHNAAVAIMFPIAVASAEQVGVDSRGFLMAITVGANLAFANPVTYQTHLIVYGPGGYRFMDFVKVGLPLDIVCGIATLAVVPRIWPF